MNKRLFIFGGVLFLIIIATTNYGAVLGLSSLEGWRANEANAFRVAFETLRELEHYVSTGDPEYLKRFDQREEQLRPLREMAGLLAEESPDWDDVEKYFDKYGDDPFLQALSTRQLRFSRFLPVANQAAANWKQSNEKLGVIFSLRVQAVELHGAPEFDDIPYRQLRNELQVLRGELEEQQASLHEILTEFSFMARIFLVGSNALLYIGFIGLVTLYFRRRVQHTELERLRSREKARERQAMYQAVVSHSREAICLLDMKNSRVIEANSAFCDLLDYAPDEVINLALREFNGRDTDDISEYLSAERKDESSGVQQHQWRTQQGELILVQVSSTIIDNNGQWLLLVARDVTHENEIDTKLATMDRMAAVGILASGVGHEINNPMAYVTANLDFAVRRITAWQEKPFEYHGDLYPVILEALVEAQEGTNRVCDIVADLKDYTRWKELDSDDISNLQDVLESTLRMAAGKTRHRAHVVRRFTNAGFVRGSETRLGQVFLNLIINAAHAIPEDTCDDHEIFIDAEPVAGEIRVRIRDTGVGIDPDDLERLFEPFFSTRKSSGGTGLGLPICMHIVESFGGRIDIDSTPGEGTTVTVWLQKAASETASEQLRSDPGSLPIPPCTPARVLVIDNQPPIASAISRLLDDCCQVENMTDPWEALERLSQKHDPSFDVIFCDLLMPSMSGLTFAQRLLEARPAARSRFGFITGGVVDEQTRQFVEEHQLFVLDKPLDLHSVRSTIAELIANTEKNRSQDASSEENN